MIYWIRFGLVLCGITILPYCHNAYSQHDLNALVMTKTNGFRHASIPHSIQKMTEWAAEENWQVRFTEDSLDIDDNTLKDVDVLVFLNTSGDILGEPQEAALTRYINQGGGFVGVHVASNTEIAWPWFHNLIGAQFKDHPKVQSAKMFVNHTFKHPSVTHLSDTFQIVDEWYNFKESVLPHVNVLLTLDENSYQGKKMGEDHPIAWYHYYEGGRVFYTGLGHTDEIYDNPDFSKHLVNAINWAGKRLDVPTPTRWENLLDKDLKKWDVYIGVPKPTVDLGPAYDDSSRKKGEPLGLNNDPKQVYSVIEEDGELLLYITGEIHGAITTKQEYSNYHFKAEFKWGEKKWGSPDRNRDSGILYHCVGPQGTYAKAWMSGLQSQIQETHFGDFIAMGDVSVQGRVDSIHMVRGEVRGVYNPRAELMDTGRAIKREDMEKPTGEWNTLEVICLGTSSIHVINGRVVSAIENAKSTLKDQPEPLSSGKILLQSEGAEAYYKDIQIKAISSVPDEYKNQMK